MNLAALSVQHKASAPQKAGEMAHESLDPKGNPVQAVREQRCYEPPKMEYTFDNPSNYRARWGKAYKRDDKRIWLEFIGWGFLHEIRGERPITATA